MARLVDNNYMCYNHYLLCFYTVPARCYQHRPTTAGTYPQAQVPVPRCLEMPGDAWKRCPIFQVPVWGSKSREGPRLASWSAAVLLQAAGCRLQAAELQHRQTRRPSPPPPPPPQLHGYTDANPPRRLFPPKPRRARHGRRARWTAAASDRQGSVRQTPTQTCYRAMRNRNVILPAHKE